MTRRDLKTSICALAAAAFIFASFQAPAVARTAYVERNDTMPVESVTIALQSAMQIYQKYILSNLAGLKSIKELGELRENFGFLNDIQDEMNGMFGKLDISEMIKLDDITDGIGQDFGNILGDIGVDIKGGFLDSLTGMFGGQNIPVTGITGVLMSGKLGGKALSGSGEDISGTAKEKGLGGAAVEVVSRTSQVMDEIAGREYKSGRDAAIMSAYSYIMGTVPMIHPEIADAAVNTAKQGLKAYTPNDTEYFLTFMADSSKSIPLAAIMKILDRHMKDESPYSAKGYEKEITEEIKTVSEELEDIPPAGILDLESPETKTTRLMGVAVRQNELTLRQYEILAGAVADDIKMEAVRAGLNTARMGDRITKNILVRGSQFKITDKDFSDKYLKETGIEPEGR